MLHPTQIRRVTRLLYVLLTSCDIPLKLSFLKNKGGFVCNILIYLLLPLPLPLSTPPTQASCIPTLKASFWLYVYRINNVVEAILSKYN